MQLHDVFTITARVKFLPAVWLRNCSGSWHCHRAQRNIRLEIRPMKGHLIQPQVGGFQHSPFRLGHYVHTLGSAPGTVRVPGKYAVIAGSVSLAVRQRQLNNAWWGANVHTRLRGKQLGLKYYEIVSHLQLWLFKAVRLATRSVDSRTLVTGSGSSNSCNSSIMCSWPLMATALCSQPSSGWQR